MTPEESRTLPVVLLPGVGLGSEAWSPTTAALHESGTLDRRLTATVLRPGYGLRAPDRRPLDPEALARTVADELGGGRPALVVAHSAGCQVAAHVALLAPQRVVALVLVGPSTDPRAATWPRLVRRWFATARSEPVGQVPTLVRQYRRTGLSAMARAMDAARRDRIEAVLEAVSCPVLVVRGLHDRIAPADWVTSLARPGRTAAAQRRAVTLDAGAHMLPLTHGPRLAGAISEFLALVDP